MITVVGLGYRADDLTVRAANVLEKSPYTVVKTVKTAAGKAVKNADESMDALFDAAEDFDSLNCRIADRLMELDSEKGGAVYCTDGDGLTDGAVRQLTERGVQFELVRGVGGGVGVPGAAKMCMAAQCAVDLRPYIDSAAGLEITEIDDKFLAGELKLYLLEYYAPNQKVIFCAARQRVEMTLEQLDRQKKYGQDCFLCIEGNSSPDKERYGLGDLERILERLTAPDGCPWDREQTHESIRSNLIEEAYEAVDAIDCNDVDALQEEIGDVLLQAVFHCNIARRTGEFTLGDALSNLCRKLYFRHTHIFGVNHAEDSSQALSFWEEAKAKEKSYTSLYDVLTRLPKGFPSLLRAQKAYKKAYKAGAEKEAEHIDESSLADRLMALVRQAASSGIDAETTLNAHLQGYIEGFKEQ